MDLAHLTREAAIQDTEVAMPFILEPVNVFLPMPCFKIEHQTSILLVTYRIFAIHIIYLGAWTQAMLKTLGTTCMLLVCQLV